MKIVAVTSCPSGVDILTCRLNHLNYQGKKFGIEIKVETQGSSGIDNELSLKDIDEATCVILTNDVEIRNMERFKGKKVVRMSVSEIIKKSDALIKKIKDTFQ